ncbi:trypsin-like serine protease [SAR202 cluster bacterium AD-493-K16_JPT_193m]|nr:trypsin-like serine protease [SAR202 cluster bacterium AD-493-K16_JPT_193m]
MLQKKVILTFIFALVVGACTSSIVEDQPPTSTIEISEAGKSESLPEVANTEILQKIDSTPTPTIKSQQMLVGSRSIADLVDSVAPAVVSIVTQVDQRSFFGTTRTTGSGSGVIFNENGYILTNNHVVEDAAAISVTLFDGRELDAKLIGRDSRTDLAVIRIDEENLSVASLGDAAQMRVGEWVVAIGNALGIPGAPTITVGVVSAKGRFLDTSDGTLSGLIQTDASINPGNSGGPLISMKGEVIGINTAVWRGDDAENIGFAVSTETAKPVADQLIKNGRVIRAYLGVSLTELDRPTAIEMGLKIREGIVVRTVTPGTPADIAGIQSEDVIVGLGLHSVPDLVALERLLIGTFSPGETTDVDLVRGSDDLKVEITLGENPI